MSINKINPIYQTNTKENGLSLDASEWNAISLAVNIAHNKINNIIDEEISTNNEPNGSTTENVVSTEVSGNKTQIKVSNILVGELNSEGTKGTNVSVSGDNNIIIESRPAVGTGLGGDAPGVANRKGGNIALKPGDDIEFWAHKRGTSKDDEVSVKMLTEVPKANDPTETDKVPAKLQLNAADINFRCEDHGSISLQPKGEDGQGHMNKIKFEHGGGDGLEFGTFNAEKTSIFTDEYRFNKDGVWKMATREKVVSDKADVTDSTTSYKYQKQADDFYDVIDPNLNTATTKQIIETANAFNNEGSRTTFAKGMYKGALYTGTRILYRCTYKNSDDNDYVDYYNDWDEVTYDFTGGSPFVDGQYYSIDTIAELSKTDLDSYDDGNTSFVIAITDLAEGTAGVNDFMYFKFDVAYGPDINITSAGELNIRSGKDGSVSTTEIINDPVNNTETKYTRRSTLAKIINTAAALNNDLITTSYSKNTGLLIEEDSKFKYETVSSSVTADIEISGAPDNEMSFEENLLYSIDDLVKAVQRGIFEVTGIIRAVNIKNNGAVGDSFICKFTNTNNNNITYYKFTRVNPGSFRIKVGTIDLDLADVTTLVNYFKNDAPDGPWANE